MPPPNPDDIFDPDFRPHGVPHSAAMKAWEDEHGGIYADYFVHGALVVRASFSADVLWLRRYGRDGLQHGIEEYIDPNGRTYWSAEWAQGKQHGDQKQWADDGRLLYCTKFVNGDGVDLWFSGNGELSELREMRQGKRHGVEQWFTTETSVYEEYYWFNGLAHGVHRRWDKNGLLQTGYPKFFVNDSETSLKKYAQASALDPNLRRYDPKENSALRGRPKILASGKE